jgi:hypothetical protein
MVLQSDVVLQCPETLFFFLPIKKKHFLGGLVLSFPAGERGSALAVLGPACCAGPSPPFALSGSSVGQRGILRSIHLLSFFLGEGGGGGVVFNRATPVLGRPVCAFRAPRPKPRLPGEVGTPLRKAAHVVRGGARPPPLAHQR